MLTITKVEMAKVKGESHCIGSNKPMLHVTKAMLHVTKAMLHVPKAMLHANKAMLHVTKAMSHATNVSVAIWFIGFCLLVPITKVKNHS